MRNGWLLACVLLLLVAHRAAAQEVLRLPRVIPPTSPFAPGQEPEGVLTSALAPPADDRVSVVPEGEPPYAADITITDPEGGATPLPPGVKPGMLQRATFRGMWLGGDSGYWNDFSFSSFTVEAMVGVPLYIAGSPILLTPTYTEYFLSGPAFPRVPPGIEEAGIEVRWMKQITPDWGLDLAVAPMLIGDIENAAGDSFRVLGRVVGLYNWNEYMQVVVGATYQGREDWPVLPIVGVIGKPSDDIRIEAVFPHPRLAVRASHEAGVEHWLYVAGEFGGNTYAVERYPDYVDKLTYSDTRIVFGWERKPAEWLSSRIEVGYVFDRELEYKHAIRGHGRGHIFPSDAVMTRFELNY